MKVPTLYQLQDSFDDEHAHQRAAELRQHIAPAIAADLRWLPLIFALMFNLALVACAFSRAVPA